MLQTCSAINHGTCTSNVPYACGRNVKGSACSLGHMLLRSGTSLLSWGFNLYPRAPTSPCHLFAPSHLPVSILHLAFCPSDLSHPNDSSRNLDFELHLPSSPSHLSHPATSQASNRHFVHLICQDIFDVLSEIVGVSIVFSRCQPLNADIGDLRVAECHLPSKFHHHVFPARFFALELGLTHLSNGCRAAWSRSNSPDRHKYCQAELWFSICWMG